MKTTTTERKAITKKTKSENAAQVLECSEPVGYANPSVRANMTSLLGLRTIEMPQLLWNSEIMSKLLEYLSRSVVTIECNRTG